MKTQHGHSYTSSVGFEYYWFGTMYVSIQPEVKEEGMADFAVIRTEESFYTKREFIKLKDKLKIIDRMEFEKAIERAMKIINERLNEN